MLSSENRGNIQAQRENKWEKARRIVNKSGRKSSIGWKLREDKIQGNYSNMKDKEGFSAKMIQTE